MNKMNILVACEYSGVVTSAFRARGHNAISCDLDPCDIPGLTEYHYRGDVRDILYLPWDMIMAFPPCTYLACVGRKHWRYLKLGVQAEALAFAKLFLDHPCKKVCVENPVGILSTQVRKPTQIINPYQFGHPVKKRTCLWLKGLEPLVPTCVMNLRMDTIWLDGNKTDRGKRRSKTFRGVASAMANQWG